jgi:hypothetical protein
MALFYVLGQELIESEEYKQKLMTGQIDRLVGAAEENERVTVGFRNVDVHSEDLPNVIPYKPIGIGKPLSVEIMTLYTGDFISNKFLAAKKRDLICTSAVKASQTFDATARAINLIEQRAAENTYLEFSALQACTPYVYYTRAVDADSLLVTVSLDSNSFNEEIFKSLGDLFGKAAGLPVFKPAAPFLLAGSQLLKVGADGGNSLFESSPFIEETVTIRFATAGLPTNIARSVLLCSQEYKSELQQYKIGYVDDGGVYKMRLMKDGVPYQGNAPYLILNIDGAEKPALDGFAPSLASAGILSKFFGGSNKIEDAAGVLLQAMSLYNDYSYRTRADKMERELNRLRENPESEEYKRTKELYDAYLKNIQNELLRK